MQSKLLLGVQAVMFSAVVGLALPGCFTVGDDDNGDAGSGGESGDTSKGGTGGSSAGSGSGGTSGTGGGACIANGDACLQNSDCCSAALTNGVCVDGTCTDGCSEDGDCTTNCCFALQSGGKACAPADFCSGTCAANGDACTANSDCCSYNDNMGYCIADLTTCAASCTSNDQCTSGCCVGLDGVDDGACAPVEYCE